MDCYTQCPKLNAVVWKVLRSSVNWKSYPTSRRILIGDKVLPCTIIGSVQEWWFVSLNAVQASRMLAER